MKQNNQSFEAKNRVVIALGDPTGIGIEVTLKALGSLDLPPNMQPLLVGCKQTVEIIYKKLKDRGIKPLANPKNLSIEDLPFKGKLIQGKPSPISGEASFHWLSRAVEIVLNGNARALVTAPIAKHAWIEAGFHYPGQTERLAELSNINQPAMLFTAKSPYNSWRLNTLLATTHIPFSKITTNLTPELIINKLDILLAFCKKFTDKPKLTIAGLNPHAGEKGRIGTEEIKLLIPAINEWKKKNPTVNLDGPISPDTCWISSAQAWRHGPNNKSPDGILALYHDQGLIPIKIIAFDYAVNTTLGLPFIRTSPDHGTGFDIAEKGIASPESMLSAIITAWELTNN